MLKIRLQRVGRTNDPSYRVVVVDSRQGPKSGKSVDTIGFYNPITKAKKIDTVKAKEWMSKGAQTSGTVYNMLIVEGVISGKKLNVLPKKRPIIKEVKEEASSPLPVTPVAAPAPEAASEVPLETAPETPSEAPAEEAAETTVAAESAEPTA